MARSLSWPPCATDGLVITTHPAYRGFGGPLFDDYEEPIDLELISHRTFDTGVTMNHYAIVGRSC